MLDEGGHIGYVREKLDIALPTAPAPLTPTLISPLAGVALEVNTTVDFSWNTSESATQYMLELVNQQALELSATTAFVPASNCVNDICLLALLLDLPVDDAYIWRVRAENETGASEWSSQSFSLINVVDDTPGAFELNSPEIDAEFVQGDVITIFWTRAAGATGFEFALIDGTNPGVALDIVVLSDDICIGDVCS